MSADFYGNHPTLYSGLGDLELYGMFRRETWSGLGEASRQQLLQEAVNRAARENGEKGSCLVTFADLEPRVAGEQADGVIYLNREMYVNDRRAVSYKGQLMTVPYPSSNLDALTTALHEDQHAYQDQIIKDVIPGKDPALSREYKSNDFTVVPLPQKDGSVKLGSTYMQAATPVTGKYLYYFQSTERDAHRVSEARTLAIVEALEAQYGTEPSFQAYRKELAVTGYDATLAEAQRLFQNPNVEREINQSLMNHYYGTQTPVDPRVEAATAAEMEASFREQSRLSLTEEARTGAGVQGTPETPEVQTALERPEVQAAPELPVFWAAPETPEVQAASEIPAAQAAPELPVFRAARGEQTLARQVLESEWAAVQAAEASRGPGLFDVVIETEGPAVPVSSEEALSVSDSVRGISEDSQVSGTVEDTSTESRLPSPLTEENRVSAAPSIETQSPGPVAEAGHGTEAPAVSAAPAAEASGGVEDEGGIE